MNSNKSVLKFEKYIVKEISFLTNEMWMENEEVELEFDFDTNMELNSEKNKFVIELRADVFPDSLRRNYPFEMRVAIKGYFSIDTNNDNVDIRMFEQNAIAILFPYLRAIVSTYTANANIVPVLLPAMNINAYIRKKYNNGEKQV